MGDVAVKSGSTGGSSGVRTRGNFTAPKPRPKPVQAQPSGPVDRASKPQKDEAPSQAGANAASNIASTFGAKSADTPGQRTVDYAREFEGMLSQDVKGKMENFTAAGGNTNNCADFVSSALQHTGRLDSHHIRVDELRQDLLDNGWRQIEQGEAQPGDVWMTESNKYGGRHTELVTQPGGTHTIGSNNIREGQQAITEREKTGGVFYTDRPAPTE